MVKKYEHIQYECEFCHHYFDDEAVAKMHENTCEFRLENLPAFREKYEDRWFEYCIDAHSTEEPDVWVYIHCLSIMMSSYGPSVRYRYIRTNNDDVFYSEIQEVDLEEFINGTMMGVSEVDAEYVKCELKNDMDGWFI